MPTQGTVLSQGLHTTGTTNVIVDCCIACPCRVKCRPLLTLQCLCSSTQTRNEDACQPAFSYAACTGKGISPIATGCEPIQHAHGDSLPIQMLHYLRHIDMLLASLCTHQPYMLKWVTLKEYCKPVKLLHTNFGHAHTYQ